MKRFFWLPLVLSFVACHDGASPTGPTGGALEASGIRLLAHFPAAGSRVAVEGCQGECTHAVSLKFSATIDAPAPAGANLKVSLLDADERECAYNWTGNPSLTVGQPATFDSDFLVLECALPFSTVAVRATLVGNQAGRPSYLEATFPLEYTFVEPTPVSTKATPPRILKLDWDAEGPTGYHACPLPDEVVGVWCSAADDDGDALTLTLRLENRGPGALSGPAETSRSFPPSSYNRDIGAYYVTQSPTNVHADCTVRDSHGQMASQSIDIPCG